MVAGALSHKAATAAIHNVCLRMMVISPFVRDDQGGSCGGFEERAPEDRADSGSNTLVCMG